MTRARGHALVLGAGVSLASGDASVLVGHLEGWGGFTRSGTPSFARSEGAPVRRRVEWVVRGQGTVSVEADSVRTGGARATVDVG